jgi:GTPase
MARVCFSPIPVPDYPMTRCGSVAIVGAPNAGKSTLLNQLVGARLAIVSPRPQSTRLPVIGVRTEGDTQVELIDTPGILDPGYALHQAMRATLFDALRIADVIVHLVDGLRPADYRPLQTLIDAAGIPGIEARTVVVVNKCDTPASDSFAPPGAVRISAQAGTGLDHLWQVIRERLPERPFRHAEDDLSTQHLRFFVGEAIREVAFEQLHEELPYAIHCEVEEFREGQVPVYIRVTVYVERESQKGIVVGQGGQQLRRLGAAARTRLEVLLGEKVYLDLWVKVLKDWRRNPATLRRLGFQLPGDES